MLFRSAFRRIVEAVQSGDAAAVESAHQTYVALVDRAASKRAIHPNTAARKKSRATRVIARGPQVEETKKRRVTRKTAAKQPVAAEDAAVEEPVAEAAGQDAAAVEEPVAEEPVADEPAAEEAPADDADEA